jgi:hypothetical protein
MKTQKSPDFDGTVVDAIETAGRRIAEAISPMIPGSSDASGGHVESLTEAVMGVTAGLCSIAAAIEHLAEAVESSRSRDRVEGRTA